MTGEGSEQPIRRFQICASSQPVLGLGSFSQRSVCTCWITQWFGPCRRCSTSAVLWIWGFSGFSSFTKVSIFLLHNENIAVQIERKGNIWISCCRNRTSESTQFPQGQLLDRLTSRSSCLFWAQCCISVFYVYVIYAFSDLYSQEQKLQMF